MRRLLLLPLLACLAWPARAETDPRVTTDSQAYCGTLSARLATLPAAAEQPARSLYEEGLRLCEAGHTRVGIARLRRALKAALERS